MTPENQSLLDAIHEVAAHLNRLETRLETRMDQLDGRMDQLDGRMDQLDGRMDQLDGRMDQLDGRMVQLDGRVETLDIRTSQIAGDILDLRDRVPLLEERIDTGFRALKSDLNFAFSDIRKIGAAQERSDKAIDGLRRELAGLQQRLATLESIKGAS
jgi:chromosome segregation ATPase